MTVIRLLCILFITCANTSAQEWTRFRGPNGNGISDHEIPAKWDDDSYNWIIDLPGTGHSSPVIWADRLFVQSADPENGTQFVVCVDTTSGKKLWTKEFKSSSYHIHTRNSFASSTPTVDERAVYIAWATPDQIRVHALTHAGESIWSREDLGPFTSQHGFGSSPIVVGDMLVLSNLQMPSKDRGAETSSVIAFDKNTGDIRWATPRTSGKTSYSVPCLHNGINGEAELLLCSTTHGMFGLDLASGKENWAVKDAFSMRTVSSPVVVGNIVFGSTGSGNGGNYVAAIDTTDASIAYKVDRQAPYVPTPVALGDLLFLWWDKGMVTCIDAASGKRHWSKRVGGNYSGSPICAGGKVYCISDDGQVVVLAASKEYQLLGKTSLGEDSRSTPAVSDGKMYLRTYSKLFSIGG
jgi:outer membrane protein assembly factor BamB